MSLDRMNMRLLIILLCLASVSFADPAWILKPQDVNAKPTAVGMAEVFFPAHVQERVALIRARTKLFASVEHSKNKYFNPKISTASVKSQETLGLSIEEKYIDAEGNLYLLVSFSE
jgi:hypothetical protein